LAFHGNVIDRRMDGRVDEWGTQHGDMQSFRYDALGRETHAFFCSDWQETCDPARFAGQAEQTTTTSYWDSGAVRSRTRPNGVVESLSYDDAGDLIGMRRTKGMAGAVLKDQEYNYDPNGNRTRDERGTHIFNARSQLVEWTRAQGPRAGTTVTYGLNGAGAILWQDDAGTRVDYCLVGDRLKSAWAGGACGQGTRLARYLYDPDGFGNLVRIEQTGRDTAYEYDSFGRLTRSDGPAASGDVETYSYDSLDRRDLRTEGGRTWHNSFVGLSERISREETPDQSRRYQYDSGLQPLGRRAVGPGLDNVFRSFALDANGSVEGLEDADGDVRDCTGDPDPNCRSDGYQYDPYGASESPETSLSPEAAANPLRFEGFYYDQAQLTYDMHARPYRPDLGRFLTQDRYQAFSADIGLLADPLTNSRYVFAGANPVNNIEFDGHDPITTHNPRGRQKMSDSRGRCFRDCDDEDFPGTSSAPQSSAPGGFSYAPWTKASSGGHRNQRWIRRRTPTRPPTLLPGARCAATAPHLGCVGWDGLHADRAGDEPGIGAIASGVGAVLEAAATSQAMQELTCRAERPRLTFWSSDCFQQSIPNPKASLDTCTSGSSAEALGRIATCAALGVLTRRSAGPTRTGPRTVVIGRDMKGRVIPNAERHGHGYYPGTPRFVPFRFERLDLWFNKRWIKREMRRGNEIIDIGEPSGMPPSRFYEMERRLTHGYSRYREDPQP
jgi:RHS repeat-associated protein